MNMISTGAFQTEMDASIKQETLAEAFVRVWEKKNSKVARAGGVSLMALTLAACGSDDDTATTDAGTDTGSTTTTAVDTDGDGVADADDAFPNDATETVDTDGDGIGDNADEFPNDSTNTPAGTENALTTAVNIIETAHAHDTFTATNTTMTTGDIISDSSSTDTDILTLTSAAAPAAAATISGVEVINVVSTSLTAITAFDADNTTGAAINVSIDRFGNDGGVTIANLEGNSLVAGSEVDTLTVTDAGTTSIDAGSATSLTVDTDTLAAGQTVEITVNNNMTTGVLTADNAGADTFVINGAFTFDITGSTLVAGDTVTAADATIEDADFATAATLTAAAAIIDTTTINIAEWTVPSITIDVAGGMNVDNAQNDQVFTIGIAQTAINEIDGEAGQTGTVTLDTAFNLNAVTTSVFTNTAINVSADVTTGTITAVDTISVTGTGDVTIGDTATATTLDASGLTGDLTLSANTGAIVDVLGGSGATTYTTITDQNTFIGQGGDDAVTLGVLAANDDRFPAQFAGGDDTLTISAASMENDPIVIADMGAGDDTVALDLDNGDSGTLTLTGGEGSDTLSLTDGADMAAATLTLTGFETISVTDAGGAAVAEQTAVFVGSLLDGITLTASVDTSAEALDANDDTLAVTVTVDEASTDLGSVTAGTGVTFTINGNDNTAETIIGSSSNDTIDTGVVAAALEANTITGGAGDDTFVFATGDSDGTAAGGLFTTITDFQAAAAAGDNDTLSIDSSVEDTTIADDGTAIAAGADIAAGTVNVSGAAAAADGLAAADVTAVVDDGVFTLMGQPLIRLRSTLSLR